MAWGPASRWDKSQREMSGAKGNYSDRYRTFQVSSWHRQSHAWTSATSVGQSESIDQPKRESQALRGRRSERALLTKPSHVFPCADVAATPNTAREVGTTILKTRKRDSSTESHRISRARGQTPRADGGPRDGTAGEGSRERSSWRPDAAHFCQHQARHAMRMLCCAKPTQVRQH